MYSQIANNTFSYILTLDEFRNSIPEEFRPSWVKITTITMVSTLSDKVDIQKFRDRMEKLGSVKLKMAGSKTEGFEWKLKPTTFYNQVTLGYQDAYSTKSVKVFPNGSIQVAGCSDLFDCKRIITQLVFLLKNVLQLEKEISSGDFRIVMINTNFSLNKFINLFEVADHFGSNDIFNVSFDPDRYSAVKVKFKPAQDMKEVTTSIFSTGKIIVTGAETLKEIAFAYNIINKFMNLKPTIYVQDSTTKDHFDIFMGYKIDSWIKKLRGDNFESWIPTKTNMRINF
jgi:TATA-box binding protein (TBP) (component of TFIID and TFIIIB)